MESILVAEPQNPYIAGKPVSDRHLFVGRADILEFVEKELGTASRSAVVLSGQRRIGKTSILVQLEARLPSTGFLPVRFDLQAWAKEPLGRLLAGVATAVLDKLGLPSIEAEHFDDEGRLFQLTFLPLLYRAIPNRQRPVILFDEFDVLDQAAEEQLAPTSAARAFHKYLQRLMEQEPRLGFVFVVGRKVNELSIEVLNLFRTDAGFQRVSVFDRPSAVDVIRIAERQGTLRFEPAAIDRVWALTSGHPFLTQLLCQAVWDVAYAKRPQKPPLISSAAVDDVVPAALAKGGHIFEWIWKGLPPAEQVILAAIAEATTEQQGVTHDELLLLLSHHRIRMMAGDLYQAPDKLVEYQHLQKTNEGYYHFLVELLRRWIAQNKPLAQTKGDLDQAVKLANHLYETGRTYYHQGKLAEAADLLGRALEANLNHFQARLHLAQVLLEQGRHSEGVTQLEEAYKFEEREARYPLIRALQTYGRVLEEDGDVERALSCYQRILMISPNELEARERCETIWVAAGDVALAAQQLEQAQGFYERALRPDKVKDVEAALKQQRIAALAASAMQLEQKEKWEEAAQVYEQILSLDDSASWVERLAASQLQIKVAQRYAEGKSCFLREDWPRALSQFCEVIQVRTDYRDVVSLLAQTADGLARAQGKSALTQAQVELKTVSKERDQFKERHAKLKAELGETQSSLAEFSKERERFKMAEGKWKSELDRLQSRFTTANEELTYLRAEQGKLDTNLEATAAERDELKQRSEQLEQELAEANRGREEFQRRILQTDSRLDTASKRVRVLGGASVVLSSALLFILVWMALRPGPSAVIPAAASIAAPASALPDLGRIEPKRPDLAADEAYAF